MQNNQYNRIANRINQIVNNGNLQDYITNQYVVEEIHNSRDSTVRLYEIPLTDEQINDRYRERVAERNERYGNRGNDIWQDRRTRNQQNEEHRTQRQRPQRNEQRVQQLEQPQQRQQRRVTINAPPQSQPLPQQPPQQEYVNPNDTWMDECNRNHQLRMNELTQLIDTYDHNHLKLFQYGIQFHTPARFACEIHDLFYSCAGNNLCSGYATIAKIVNPSLYEQSKHTFYRGSPSYQTDHYLLENGLLSVRNREIDDLIFDYASLMIHVYNQHVMLCDLSLQPEPTYAHIEHDNQLFFNDEFICTLSEQYDFPNGLIFLYSMPRNDQTRSMFEKEKKIFEILNHELWYALINVLRKRYRCFNNIPSINIPLKRCNSFDNLSSVAQLDDGLTNAQREPITIPQQNRIRVRPVVVKRGTIDISGIPVGEEIIIKRKPIHARPTYKNEKRIDYRDHNVNEYRNNYECGIEYFPVNFERYNNANDMSVNWSEDDGEYISVK